MRGSSTTAGWVIAFNPPLSEKISRRTLKGCDWKGLLELIEEVRARVSRETGRAVEAISCYEAGYDGFWLHRQLEAHGIRNYVIDPASLQVDRRARRVKTDRIDAERLLRSLMAYLRGEPKVWSVVRVPSQRHRAQLEQAHLARQLQHPHEQRCDVLTKRRRNVAMVSWPSMPPGQVIKAGEKRHLRRDPHRQLDSLKKFIAEFSTPACRRVRRRSRTHSFAKAR
jgi:hypothetical protein